MIYRSSGHNYIFQVRFGFISKPCKSMSHIYCTYWCFAFLPITRTKCNICFSGNIRMNTNLNMQAFGLFSEMYTFYTLA
jgi:hypothetical protein